MKPKFCYRCGKWKKVEDFYKNSTTVDNCQSSCKDCVHESQKLYAIKNAARAAKLRKENPYKVCGKCNRKKSIHLYGKNNHAKDGLQYYCTFCQRKVMREYQQTHVEENRQRVKEWQEKYPERVMAYNRSEKSRESARQYYYEHREEVLKKLKERYKKTKELASSK